MISLDGEVCRQSRWRHSEPQTRWRICVNMTTLRQQQDGGYMLLWKRYGNNKMAAMHIKSLILHLQQYSHRLNLFFLSFTTSEETTHESRGTALSASRGHFPTYQCVTWTPEEYHVALRRKSVVHSTLSKPNLCDMLHIAVFLREVTNLIFE